MKISNILSILFLAAMIFCSGCTSGLKDGQTAITKEKITVTVDYEVVEQKECSINANSPIVVSGFSQFIQGNAESVPLIRLTSTTCTGYLVDDSSLLGSLDIKH